MNRKKIIAKNGIIGLSSQFITQILNFLLRRYILKCFGVEILGLNSTLTSVISTLSLAELGFQQAVVFHLYKPLKENDFHRINSILLILKRVYEVIGGVFIVASLVMSIFLRYILKGIVINRTVFIYYFIICLNVVMTYFVSYRRAILYADQREYISQEIDSIIGIIAFAMKYVGICFCNNFSLYLSVQVIQTVVSNILISRYCKRRFPYLGAGIADKEIFFVIYKDVKNVFVSKIAGFIYGATDNLIISIVLGTVQVGYLSNYAIFINALKQAVNSMFHSMTAVIGNLLNEKSDRCMQESLFRIYAYFRYLLATIIVVPWVLLSDNLVGLFWGEEYVLEDTIHILLAIDLYIDIVYSLCCEYINGGGYFRYDRNVSVIGGTINLVVSMILAKKIGVTGVLAGTVVSQIFFWIARSRGVYRKVFVGEKSKYLRYVVENVVWVMAIWVVIVTSRFIDRHLGKVSMIVSIVRIFVVCEIVNLVVQIVLLTISDKRKAVWQIIKNRSGSKGDSC